MTAKVGIIGLCAILALGGMQASAAEDDYDEMKRFPGQGLANTAERGQWQPSEWVAPQQSGLAYLKQAKQWVRTPTLQSVAYNRPGPWVKDLTGACARFPEAPGAEGRRQWAADVTLMNPDETHDSARRFGHTQSFETRTIAFGSVPVEATVALEQPRNAKGVVIPAKLTQDQFDYCAGGGDFEIPPPNDGVRYMPAEGGGRLRVRIDQVVVDGVKLNLTGACVADKASLTLTSRDYLVWDTRIPPQDRAGPDGQLLTTKYLAFVAGGLLLGSLDIPAFAGCTTAGGDDISALLTATVSGDGNAVQIRTQSLGGESLPAGTDPFTACPYTRKCVDAFPVPELPTEPPS